MNGRLSLPARWRTGVLMNTRRSYLDSTSAGRQPGSTTSFDDLDRKLADLEGKLQRGRQASAPAWTERPRAEAYAPPAPGGRGEPAHGAYTQPAPRQELRTLAGEFETARRQEDSLAAIGKIAGELKAMREELRQQMNHGLKREFDALRHDIQRLHAAAPAVNGAELGAEFDRLSDAVHSLAGRGDDKSVKMLRLELEQVKSSLDGLAREDTVKSYGRRWDDFDRRWSRIEGRLDTPGSDFAPNLNALNRQLEQIGQSVNRLPESLSVRSLEERLKALAASVEQFAQHYGATMPDAFALIEQRLDEISRAIAASGAAPQQVAFDTQPFERIEARVGSLARQIDELIAEHGSSEVLDRLNRLSQRVDEIAQRVEIPETIVGRLADQIAVISDRLQRDPADTYPDALFHGLEERFAQLSQILERRQDDAMEQGHRLFHDLERRLDTFAERIQQPVPQSFKDSSVIDAIDARFAELAARIEGRAQQGEAPMSHELEQRLEEISYRLEQSARHAAAIDPDMVRNLEAQVAALSEHLARPGRPLPEFEDLSPRLDHLEQSLAGNREAIVDAARRAAQDAVQAMAQSPSDPAVSGLASELRSLDQLARRSDERNAKTFEAIHDTLLKIVDRLGALEQGTAAAKPRLDETPPLAADTDDEPFGRAPGRGGSVTAHTRSPAEAATAAANHALSKAPAPEHAETAATGRVSVLSGLTRAFRKDKEAAAEIPAVASPVEPTMGLDEPIDAKLANQPLEPGSGAPDLNAIIRRVREEHGGQAGGGETAKSDFIAAARRAAQAAAAEAQATRGGGEKLSSGGKLKIGEMFKARRKTMLLGATALMVVLAGLQLGKAFLADGDVAPAEVAAIETQPQQPDLKAEAMPQAAPETAEAAAPVRSVDQPATADEQTAALPAPQEAEPAIQSSASETALAPAAGPAAPAASADDAQPQRVAALSPQEATVTQVPQASEAATPVSVKAPAEVGNEALRDAADNGDPKAMFEIGSRYAEGRGVKNDMAKAAEWYKRAADLGYAPAQYRIGNFHEKGIGVGRDIAAAKSWYEKAAKQGNASAMHNLAVLYAMGADGKVDNDQAARWFTEAAELGVKDSQYNLGILAAKGAGMPQSLEESYKWFALVAKTGDRDAASKRDEVAKALRPEQLAKAKAAVELWKAREVDPETNVVDIPEDWSAGAQTASIDMKQAITNIQAILNKNGYDAGPADGMMGQKTRSAIMAFQTDNGMTADGEVSEALLNKLLDRK
jgi:localization factor PodJL